MNLYFTLDVVPRSKKNSMVVGKRKDGSTYVGQNEKYQAFEKKVINLVEEQDLQLHINTLINVKVHFYCESRRKIDITNLLGAIDDALVKAGVIEDDNRNIIAAHDGSRVYWDKEHPRIEIWIEDLKEEYQEWNTKK